MNKSGSKIEKLLLLVLMFLYMLYRTYSKDESLGLSSIYNSLIPAIVAYILATIYLFLVQHIFPIFAFRHILALVTLGIGGVAFSFAADKLAAKFVGNWIADSLSFYLFLAVGVAIIFWDIHTVVKNIRARKSVSKDDF